MEVINYENRNKVLDDRFNLFAKHGKNRIKTGDVLLVESYTSMTSIKNLSDNSLTKGGTTAFAGICICIRRKGVDTNFTLRNIILKVGVEQKFFINSPLIKSIKILSRGEGYRRAKLFYLREQPGKAFQISDLLKKERERKEINSKQSTIINNKNNNTPAS
jgi:large subunit ribosomal protein L19